MKVYTASEMRKIDSKAISGSGIPSLALMENAAKAVVSKMLENYPPQVLYGGITVAAGKGNNGGDALAVARILRSIGFSPEVFVFARENEISGDAKVQAERYSCHGRMIFVTDAAGFPTFEAALARSAVVLDGLLGTGTKGKVSGLLAGAVDKINNFDGVTVSIDIPSGLSGDSFIPSGPCVLADLTITLGAVKPPLVSPECENAVGKLEVADIGIPADAFDCADLKGEAVDAAWASTFFRGRERKCHKGTLGHLLIIAGGRGKSGAAILSAKSALRAGAGLVTVAVPEKTAPLIAVSLPEAMTLPLPSTEEGNISREALDTVSTFLEKTDAAAIGPGLGTDPGTAALVRELYASSEKPFVVDADGINSFDGFESLLASHRGPRLLTPHPGELGRLLNIRAKTVVEDRYSIAAEKAREWELSLLVKGYRSFMADRGGRWRINLSGGPHMAAPGMGDVLTGIIGALLARGMDPFDALALAVFWHGAAADEVFRGSGYGILASEVSDALPLIEARERTL